MITDEVGKIALYTLQTVRRTLNSEDGIFAQARSTTTMISIQHLTGEGVRGVISDEIARSADPSAVSTPGNEPNGVRPTKQTPISPPNLSR